VSAWCHENGLVLGEEQVCEKSNEVTAIPLLLESLALKDMTILPSRDLIKKQEKIPQMPPVKEPSAPVCQIESAIKHATPSSDSLPISKNINALLHASISWIQPSSLFFALACLNVLKHFVNSTIIRSLKPRGVRSRDRRATNATLIQSAAPVTVKTWEVVEGVSQRPTGCPRNQSCQRIQTPLGPDKGLRATLDTRALWLRDAEDGFVGPMFT